MYTLNSVYLPVLVIMTVDDRKIRIRHMSISLSSSLCPLERESEGERESKRARECATNHIHCYLIRKITGNVQTSSVTNQKRHFYFFHIYQNDIHNIRLHLNFVSRNIWLSRANNNLQRPPSESGSTLVYVQH